MKKLIGLLLAVYLLFFITAFATAADATETARPSRSGWLCVEGA